LPISSKVILILSALAISCGPVSGVATAQSSQRSKTMVNTSTKGQSTLCESPTSTPTQSSQAPSGVHTVTLKWNASVVSPGHGKADGYRIYRSLKPADPPVKGKCIECQLLGEVPAPCTTYIDHTLTNGTTYYYYVFAVNPDGVSGPSNEASAPIPADQPASPPKGSSNLSEQNDHRVQK
jgi:hypothetical protein